MVEEVQAQDQMPAWGQALNIQSRDDGENNKESSNPWQGLLVQADDVIANVQQE